MISPAMFSTPDDESLSKADALRPWLRRLWTLAALDGALVVSCALVLLARDSGHLGGFHGTGTTFCIGALFLAAPTLSLLSLVLGALGGVGLFRVGPGRGFGLTALGALLLFSLSAGSLALAIGLAAA